MTTLDADPFYAALMRAKPSEDGPPDVAQVLAAYVRRPAWHDEAACRGVGTEVFFIERGGRTDTAKALCAACPVRLECSDAGQAEPYGVWAGQSPQERRAVRSSGYRGTPAA